MFFKTTRGIQVRLTKNQPVATIRRKVIKSSRENAVARARRIQIMVAVVVLTILKLLSSAFFSRPQVTTLFFIWLLGVFFFVATEATGVLHASQKTENKFWMADDSPLRLPYSSRGILLGFFIIMASTYLVHFLHKRSHRQTLENRASIPKNRSYREAISSLADETADLDSLVTDVNASLAKLESAIIPGGFRRIFDKTTISKNERKIIDTFRNASRAQLNYLVLHVNMNVVLYRLKNHFNKKVIVEVKAASDGNLLVHAASSSMTVASSVSTKTAPPAVVVGTDGSLAALAGESEKSLLRNQPCPSSMRDDASLLEVSTPLISDIDEIHGPTGSAFGDDDDDMRSVREQEEGGSRPASESGFYEDSVDSDLAKHDHRNALVELLCKERLDDLTTSARASVLDAIQVIGMMRNPFTKDRAQRWAANIILDTRGDQLSELKTITDAKGSVHSMHKLVYNDITDEAIRASLLSHFQANKRTKLGRKVLSDVDDTLISSGGAYPAGIDHSYPRHCVYPGAGAFYEALDRGVSGTFAQPQVYGSKVDVDTDSEGEEDWSIVQGRMSSSSQQKKKRIVVGNLVFLSARPHIYKDMAEKRVYSKFERMIRAKNLHAMPTLLPGDLESGQAYMLRGDFEPMARKKLKNMVEYHSIYPEFTHVFVCDNGQADVRAAELMKERLGNSLEAVYVHLVQPIDKTFGYTEGSLQKWTKMGIFFYKTFVGAAADACKRKFIDAPALRQVCLSSVKEFVEVASLHASKFPGGLLGIEERRLDLTTDLVKANELLEQLGYQAVAAPRALCMFPVGSAVHTRYFGEGFVRAFRPVDGIYEVALLSGGLIGHFTALDLRSTSWGKGSGGLFAGHGPTTNNNSHASIQVGCRVSTPYGEGVVRRYRPSDEIFEVILTKWPALAFLREESVASLTEAQSARTRFWGLGKALIRRTFSSARSQQTSPTQKPFVSPTTGGAKGVPSPTIVPPKMTYEVGTRVNVPPFGAATVVAPPREEDTIVQVKFDDLSKTYGYIPANFLIPNVDKKTTSIVASAFKLPPVNVAARAMSAILFRGGGGGGGDATKAPPSSAGHHHSSSSHSPLKTGGQVDTPYGKGLVVDPDRPNGMVAIHLDWGADATLQRDVVRRIEPTMTTRILSMLSRTDTSSSSISARSLTTVPSYSMPTSPSPEPTSEDDRAE